MRKTIDARRSAASTSGARPSGLGRWKSLTLPAVLLGSLLVASCGTQSEPLRVETTQTRILPQIVPRPTPLYAPATPQPRVATPETTLLWNDEVAEGERIPYAYVCFDTQDRLTLQGWMEDAVRHIRQLHSIIDHYEREIRALRAAD